MKTLRKILTYLLLLMAGFTFQFPFMAAHLPSTDHYFYAESGEPSGDVPGFSYSTDNEGQEENCLKSISVFMPPFGEVVNLVFSPVPGVYPGLDADVWQPPKTV